MGQRVRRFVIGQTAKMMGVLYGLMGLIFVPVFVVVALFAPKEAGHSGFSVWLTILLPIFYGVVGFIIAAIGCALYNWVAGMIGGIEIELDASTTRS